MLKILCYIQANSFITVAFSCTPLKHSDNYRFSVLQQSVYLVKADLHTGHAHFESRVEHATYPDLFVIFVSPFKQCG